MRRGPTQRAVVCDDDAILRGVLGTMLEDCGYRVVGEADGVVDAMDLVARQRVDVVVVDLALATGSGEDLLRRIHDDHPDVVPVVFSAFPEDVDALLALGAGAVYAKPDFEGLEAWLRARTEQPAFGPNPDAERRRPPQPAPILPDPGPRSPSGLEPWATFRVAVDRLWPGDAVLGFDVTHRDAVAARGEAALLLDHRLTLARLVSPTLRTLDRLAVSPQGVPVALLVAGHPEAPSAVYGRLEDAWDRAGLDGRPAAAFAHVRPERHPAVALERVLRTLAEPGTTEHPLRLA